MFHVRIQAPPSTSKMVPVLPCRIHEGMELPEKEALGEIIPGSGEIKVMNCEKFLESVANLKQEAML